MRHLGFSNFIFYGKLIRFRVSFHRIKPTLPTLFKLPPDFFKLSSKSDDFSETIPGNADFEKAAGSYYHICSIHYCEYMNKVMLPVSE